MTSDRSARSARVWRGGVRSRRNPAAAARPRARLAPVRRSRLRRRLSAGARLVAALALFGGLYTAFAPGSQAEDSPGLSERAVAGKRLYDNRCISCHGRNAQGVPDRGPSLVGVGSASVEFQVTTGRMPLARQEAQGQRKEPALTDDQARQIGAYVQELGGGPELPEGDDLRADADIAKGGELFRVNCASCHSFGTGGGALSSGKSAPNMDLATDRQMYAAMLTGPQNMPVFGDNQLTPDEKRDIIAYVQDLKKGEDPGGWGMGHYGPVPEGLVIFLVGMVALVFASLWIAGKS